MREKAYKYLKQKNIITRKYWYPLISEQNIYDLSKNKNSLRNAKKLSERVLFLPIFPDLDESTIVYISNILNKLNLKLPANKSIHLQEFFSSAFFKFYWKI